MCVPSSFIGGVPAAAPLEPRRRRRRWWRRVTATRDALRACFESPPPPPPPPRSSCCEAAYRCLGPCDKLTRAVGGWRARMFAAVKARAVGPLSTCAKATRSSPPEADCPPPHLPKQTALLLASRSRLPSDPPEAACPSKPLWHLGYPKPLLRPVILGLCEQRPRTVLLLGSPSSGHAWPAPKRPHLACSQAATLL